VQLTDTDAGSTNVHERTEDVETLITLGIVKIIFPPAGTTVVRVDLKFKVD
jgi:hypothetical protein